MADRKISELTALTTPAAGDYLPIIDISEPLAANKNKRITIEELLRGAPDGTAGAPGFAFESDPDSGLYSTGANGVALSTGGTGRLFIDASGNVGINNAADPTSILKLTQLSDATSGGIQIVSVDGNGAIISRLNDGGLTFRNGGFERLRITSTGQLSHIGAGSSGSPAVSFNGSAPSNSLVITSAGLVGIGTSSPQARLHITDATGTAVELLRLETGWNSPSGNKSITWADGTNVLGRISVDYTAPAAAMRFGSLFNSGYQTSDLMTLTPTGLGIGATSPVATLHSRVDNAGSGSTPLLIQNRSVSANTAVGISFAPNTSDTADRSAIIYGVNSSGGSGNATDLAFHTNANGSSPTERLRITSAGLVGIGTSSPSGLLHVAGQLYSSGTGYTGTNSPTLRLINSTATTGRTFGINSADSGGFQVFDASAGDATRLWLDSSGRVGINTVSPATLVEGRITGGGGTPATSGTSQPNAVFRVSGSGTTGVLDIGCNSGAPWIQATDRTDLSQKYDLLLNPNGGRVGIGTTSPIANLHVVNPTTTSEISLSGGTTAANYSQIGFYGGSTRNAEVSANSAFLTLTHQNSGVVRVETGGTERARIDSDGRLLVGASSAFSAGGDAQYGRFHMVGNTSVSTGHAILALGRGEAAAAITADEALGYITFSDNTGNTFASIHSAADANAGAGDYPGRLVFSTTADGASSPTERMRIDSVGRVGIGTTTFGAANHILTVAGGYSVLNGLRISGADTGNSIYQSGAFGLSSDNYITFGTGVAQTERARIDSSGRLLIGTSSSRAVSDWAGNGPQGLIQIEAANSGAIMSIISAGTADAQRAGTLSLGRHRNSTVGGTPTVVQSGDALGAICFAGGDGADMLANGASIRCEVDGTPGTDDMPGRLVFSTTADGASLPSPRMTITSAGNVGIGTTSPSYALDVSGQIRAAANATLAQLRLERTGSSTGHSWLGAQSDALLAVLDSSFAEKMRLDSSGRLLVGTSSARSNFLAGGASARVQVENAGEGTAELSAVRNVSSNSGGLLILGKSRSSAVGAVTTVINGDQMGWISFQGADGTNLVEGASIRGEVDGVPGANDMPGRLVFSTTADGASSPTERLRIESTGRTGTYASASDGFQVSSNAAAGTAYANFVGRHDGGAPFGGTISLQIWNNGNIQNTNNSYTAISDIKLKENVVDANSQWSDIKALQVRNYNLKEGQTHRQIGLIAQEVEPISPGLVYESPDRDVEGNDLGTVTKSVNYSVLYMKAVKALQEAMERIETLEAKVAALEGA